MPCAKCDKPTAGKSKYCTEHRAAARKLWKETIEAKAEERAMRIAKHAKLVYDAHAAGSLAIEGMSDDCVGGCGFAWVKVRPATSSFGRWLKSEDIGNQSYAGGVDIPVSVGGQSVLVKEEYAKAYAKVLTDAGIDATVHSRLD